MNWNWAGKLIVAQKKMIALGVTLYLTKHFLFTQPVFYRNRSYKSLIVIAIL